MKFPKHNHLLLIAVLLGGLTIFWWEVCNQPVRVRPAGDFPHHPTPKSMHAASNSSQVTTARRSQSTPLSPIAERGSISFTTAPSSVLKQNIPESLTDEERRVLRSLWNDFDFWEKYGVPNWSQEEVEQRATEIGKICARHRLSRKQVTDLVGRAPITNETCIAYPYGPSKALLFEFDNNGNLILVELIGQPPLWEASKPQPTNPTR